MLGDRKLTAFLATSDPTRATAFYRDRLGLELLAQDEAMLVFRTPGTLLRIQKVSALVPAAFTALGWQVPDLAGAIAALVARGVVFERYPNLAQDDAGIWTAPNAARVAWFRDPDGNVLSLTEAAPEGRSDKIIPEIFVHDGPGALAFYRQAFGAIERSRLMTRDGSKLVHGELEIAGHRLFVCDEFSAAEGGTCRTPRTLGGTGVRITLEVDDADAVVARAVAAGATLTLPVRELFWGARYGKLIDPYGHEWGINQQLRVLAPDEEAEQAQRYFAKK